MIEVRQKNNSYIHAVESQNIAQRISIRQRAIEQTFLEQGADLIKMCEYVEVSPSERVQRFHLVGHESFESFVSSPEINIRIRSAHLYKTVVEKFVYELGCDPRKLVKVGVSKLGLLWSVVNEDNADHWLATAVSVSRSDLLQEIDDYYSGQSGYDAERERPFAALSFSWSDPPMTIYSQITAQLVNALIEADPGAEKRPLVKTAVEVMKRLK